MTQSTETTRPLSWRYELRQVAEKYHMTIDEITGPSRARKYILPRLDFALRMRARNMSFPQIGRMLNRDHTTIINLVEPRNHITRPAIPDFVPPPAPEPRVFKPIKARYA